MGLREEIAQNKSIIMSHSSKITEIDQSMRIYANQIIEWENELKDIDFDIDNVERQLEHCTNVLQEKEKTSQKSNKNMDQSYISSVADDLYGSRMSRLSIKDSIRESV